MINKKMLISVIVFSTLLSSISVYLYQMFYSPNFLINQKDKFLIIEDNMNFNDVRNKLIQDTILNDVLSFSVLSKAIKYNQNIKSGAYKIKSNMSNYSLIKMLRSGNQTPINISFNYARKIEDLAKIITKDLKITNDEFMEFINNKNNDLYEFNAKNIMAMFLANTYEVYWNITIESLFNKMHFEYTKFWNKERINKSNKLKMSTIDISILASIVASETLKMDEANTIAGVYINRLKKNMYLQADPTLVYAANDFSIKRVLNKHKKIASPYNTYINKGLPPGPIKLTTKEYIDAVLNYEKHKYIYFCAKDDFSGYHVFATKLSEHNKNAKKFQRALNKRKIYR
ncbi:MAG: endolytic transglycosylase MltG [Marinoscillum sp.]